MLKFDANVSLLWREVPFVERFQKAKDAGFDTVEFLWPYGEDLGAIADAIRRLGLGVALHNMDGGKMASGERGYANDPARVSEWRGMFAKALALAERVQCTRLNCLPGNTLPHLSHEAQLDQIVENFRWALPQAERQGVTLLIEPLNTFDSPAYPYGHTADGLALIQRIDSPAVRLQYDVYHMTRMEGNVPQTIRAHAGAQQDSSLLHPVDAGRFGGRADDVRPSAGDIAHIQIADDPGRHEPGSGRIDWREVFSAIEDSGYNGFVGLEYNPLGSTEDSLGWLPAGQDGADGTSRVWRTRCTTSELNLKPQEQ